MSTEETLLDETNRLLEAILKELKERNKNDQKLET